jgi:hypothetical protein
MIDHNPCVEILVAPLRRQQASRELPEDFIVGAIHGWTSAYVKTRRRFPTMASDDGLSLLLNIHGCVVDSTHRFHRPVSHMLCVRGCVIAPGVQVIRRKANASRPSVRCSVVFLYNHDGTNGLLRLESPGGRHCCVRCLAIMPSSVT